MRCRGVGVLAAPLVAGLVIVTFTREWRHLVPFVLVLPLKLGIEKGLVKQLVERQRSFVSIAPDVKVWGPAFEGLSFPAGHPTTAFAVAVLVSAFLPRRWRPAPLAWAGIVGVARTYYREHNVLDGASGVAMGPTFGVIRRFVFLNRYVESTRYVGSLHQRTLARADSKPQMVDPAQSPPGLRDGCA